MPYARMLWWCCRFGVISLQRTSQSCTALRDWKEPWEAEEVLCDRMVSRLHLLCMKLTTYWYTRLSDLGKLCYIKMNIHSCGISSQLWICTNYHSSHGFSLNISFFSHCAKTLLLSWFGHFESIVCESGPMMNLHAQPVSPALILLG